MGTSSRIIVKTYVLFGMLFLSMEAGATMDSIAHAPNYEEDSKDHSKSASSEEPSDMTELILNCIFSSVPYVGGKWLTKIIRGRIPDDTLMGVSYSFVEGGKLLGRIMGFDTKSPAVTFFDRLDTCFDEDTYLADYDDVIVNDVITHDSDVTGLDGLLNTSEYQEGETRNKRRKRSSGGYKKKNGKDSLIGFSILGILIVGAMIAYLIYLLT
ncbi:uncharacterized protein [Palaemon carinicauda]|uniref:uncharacterized protein n=1 Tax=Palaemon carinicauda TaxID=392227 RepID=UPI0035B61149